MKFLSTREWGQRWGRLLEQRRRLAIGSIVCVCVSVCVCVCALSHVRLFANPWTPSGSSVHGIFQARILEWVAISFSLNTVMIFGVGDLGR